MLQRSPHLLDVISGDEHRARDGLGRRIPWQVRRQPKLRCVGVVGQLHRHTRAERMVYCHMSKCKFGLKQHWCAPAHPSQLHTLYSSPCAECPPGRCTCAWPCSASCPRAPASCVHQSMMHCHIINAQHDLQMITVTTVKRGRQFMDSCSGQHTCCT